MPKATTEKLPLSDDYDVADEKRLEPKTPGKFSIGGAYEDGYLWRARLRSNRRRRSCDGRRST